MRQLLSITAAVFFLLSSNMADSFEIPKLKSHVNDYAGVLSREAADGIEKSTVELVRKDGTQVVALTVKNMGDAADIKEYAHKVFVDWGLGQRNIDNGVLIVLAVKERMVRIEVGKGLEEYLTDANSAQIIRAATPLLAKRDYSAGLLQIVGGVDKVVSGKFTAAAPADPQRVAHERELSLMVDKAVAVSKGLFFLILVVTGWLVMRPGKRPAVREGDNERSEPEKKRNIVKTWGPGEFDNQVTARAGGSSRDKAATTVSPVPSRQRQSDDNQRRGSSGIGTAMAVAAVAVMATSSSDQGSGSSDSGPDFSGGGGDSGGGGSDSSF